MNMVKNKFLNCINGFTLAEVLITLVVIGVVAAMTIPNVVYNNKKHEYSSKFKKFYSTMTQASIRAKADGKDWGDWAATHTSSSGNSSIAEFTEEYLFPYISVAKKNSSSSFYFADGTYVSISKGNCLDIIFDANGDKKPNQEGRDRLRFLFCPTSVSYWKNAGTFMPYQPVSLSGREQLRSSCAETPYYCSALLMLDGWEYKDDYPYRL